MKNILLGFIAIGLLTFVGCGTKKNEGSGVTDVDGNTYQSVIIGTQEWMSENLDVGHFRNGDIVPEVKTEEEWRKAGDEKRPAWCYYNNDSSNGEKYGKLYNWYAVSDPRGLAPNDWHVSTDGEWTVLTDYLAADGHSGKQGKALKATSSWDNKNDGTSGNGTDNYGWNGLPGALRGLKGFTYGGYFNDFGSYGFWWSSSQNDIGTAWSRHLVYYSDRVSRDSSWESKSSKNYGFSVRCLRD